MHIVFWLENLKGRGKSEDQDVDGRIILIDHKEIAWEGVDWINLA
jgi:hypothetical protein